MAVEISEHAQRLLSLPLYGALGTVRPDNTPQVNPMWFDYDGEYIKFTHITSRAKYRNLQKNPAMSFMVLDPDTPFRYVEVRGRLVGEEADPTGAFYVHLQNKYGNDSDVPPPDAAQRVILLMSVEHVSGQ
ncbi:PPOX class F420-dependent oxidoreductase [Millisia brevis]|uniref:PPOX class F420-dependent oxidoreductase n=1 Tax=Millisia brevis TaxID=264148 RepID=UPI00082C28E6|nr:PPOX class F420-dependent oxidoreductase [Millisia brevis]